MNSQKQDVLALVKNSSLNPTDFAWEEPPRQFRGLLGAVERDAKPEPPTEQLTYAPSDGDHFFRFKFVKDDTLRRRTEPRNHQVEFRPTADGDVVVSEDKLDWENALRIFHRWITVIEVEEATPDVWEKIRAGREQFEDWDSEKPGSEPFTPEERQRLEEGLDEFEQRVKEKFDLQQEQIDTLEQLVQDLKDQLDTVKRRQWQTSAIGFIVRVGFSVGFSDTDFGEAFRFFEDFLDNLPQLPSAS